MWLSFTGLVLFLLALDLGVLNRKNRVISVGQSLILSAFYIGLGLLYGAGIWFTLGADAGMNYLTGELGDAVTGMPLAQVKDPASNATLSALVPTRSGYTFDKWYPNTLGTGGESYAAGAAYASNNSVTLYAKWNANSNSVTFDANSTAPVFRIDLVDLSSTIAAFIKLLPSAPGIFASPAGYTSVNTKASKFLST